MRKAWQCRKSPQAKGKLQDSVRLASETFSWETGMKTTERSKADPPMFTGKWTVMIAFAPNERPHRHGQLQLRLRAFSQRMLTRTLRNLEPTGLITRSATGPNGRGVEYSLTHLGKTFITPPESRWARQNQKDISAEIRIVERGETR
jgi:DNA-binding HxlR family transcriptional regulator